MIDVLEEQLPPECLALDRSCGPGYIPQPIMGRDLVAAPQHPRPAGRPIAWRNV